jgi:hypothetical protein
MMRRNAINDGNGNKPGYDAEDRIVSVAGYTYYYDAKGVRMEKAAGKSYKLLMVS